MVYLVYSFVDSVISLERYNNMRFSRYEFRRIPKYNPENL